VGLALPFIEVSQIKAKSSVIMIPKDQQKINCQTHGLKSLFFYIYNAKIFQTSSGKTLTLSLLKISFAMLILRGERSSTWT